VCAGAKAATDVAIATIPTMNRILYNDSVKLGLLVSLLQQWGEEQQQERASCLMACIKQKKTSTSAAGVPR
jgi:hypothetical protein